MNENVTIRHLEAARSSLRTERARIEQALADVEHALSGLAPNGTTPKVYVAQSLAPEQRRKPTVPETILYVLTKLDGEEMHIGQIEAELNRLGIEAKSASIRSQLSKLVQEKKLANPRRGYYRLAKEEVVTDEK